MKKVFTLVILFSQLIHGQQTRAQIAYSPLTDSLASLCTDSAAMLVLRQLAGDTTIVIDGQTTTIASRHYLNAGNAKAADFIFEKLSSYVYATEVQQFSGTRGENIIATKTGTRFPDQEFIICAHYDNMPSGSTAPGADDNGSGTAAVLEAARVLAPFEFDYTIRFALWDEEEIGLVGSYAYAQRAYNQGNNIIGVLNLDMIAWDSDNNFLYTIATNDISQAFTADYIATTAIYQPQLNHNYHYTTASDHASFWQFGYPAMLAIEDWYDFNAYYHTTSDNIAHINTPYFGSFARAAIANIAAQAWDQRIQFSHNPVVSGSSTLPREAILTVSSNHAIATGENAPRIYCSNNGSTFDSALPLEVTGNTYRFEIPGYAIGTTVEYYFAVQDSAATIIATYPGGGRGINPPGTTPPGNHFTYMVDQVVTLEACSPNTPRAIGDMTNTYDQFEVTDPATLLDLDLSLDITHTRTADLRIILKGPDNTSVLLSDRNGGDGHNYNGTVFDDEAPEAITDALPPFTGRYRPQFPLSLFDGKPINGIWQLRINDGFSGNTGTLNSWCLHLLYQDPSVGINPAGTSSEPEIRIFPNPASLQVSFAFTLNEPDKVSILLYNAYGQEILRPANQYFAAGSHQLVATVNNLEPGTYIFQFLTSTIHKTGKIQIQL